MLRAIGRLVGMRRNSRGHHLLDYRHATAGCVVVRGGQEVCADRDTVGVVGLEWGDTRAQIFVCV